MALKLVSDPTIVDKIRKMQQRVRWQDSLLRDRQIDQTRLEFQDDSVDAPEFSFLVIGDSGSGYHRGDNPQRRVAELMLPHLAECRFMLHTGDVIYMVGSSEFYRKNFIEPYREWLVDGANPKTINFDHMTFDVPILPIPGNHDYYDMPIFLGLFSGMTLPLRNLLQSKLDLDIGWHGSWQGDAYARAFLDYLQALKLPNQLAQHLDEHYTAKTDTGRCLSYQPKVFTRLPNRYYQFRYGGIDFFALDSNTFNAPLPLPDTREGQSYRQRLEQQRNKLEQEKQQILETSAQLNKNRLEESEQLDDFHAKISQIEEDIVDIDKQLNSNQSTTTDTEQLSWLKQRLIQSWNTESVRGRVIYFHHPPYVTETSKWQQAQTLAVRTRLQQVLDEVATELGSLPAGKPVVNLVLNGHAHCLEYLQTLNTGHADSNTHWIVCGGSGFSLRRQRTEGAELSDPARAIGDLAMANLVSQRAEANNNQTIARSQLFVGRNGQGSQKRRPYSCLRIDVKGEGRSPQLIIRPLIAEYFQHQWHRYEMKPFSINF